MPIIINNLFSKTAFSINHLDMKYFYLSFLLLLFSNILLAQKYIIIRVDSTLVKNNTVKLFKNEIFEFIQKENSIKYGKDLIKIENNLYELYPRRGLKSFINNKDEYIELLTKNPNRWLFNMSTIRQPNRPIHIYKENGFRKSNHEKFVKDDTISIAKNTLGQVFRIAIKDAPSIVYYFDEVEERLNGNSKQDSSNIVVSTITDTIGRQELNEEIDSLSKQLNAKSQEITQLEERLEKQKKKIEKLEKRNTEGTLENWVQSNYTRILLLTFLLLVLSLMLLFFRPKNKPPKKEDKEEQKQEKETSENTQQQTRNKGGGQKKTVDSIEILQKNLKSEFEKLLEKQKGEIKEEFNTQVKAIENNLNTNINKEITPLQENQIEILEILKQLNNERTNPIIEEDNNPPIDENNDNSSFESASVSFYPITSNDNKSFIQAVKPILDILNQALSNIRKEGDIKEGGTRVVSNIVQRFDKRNKLLDNEGTRWSNIFKQIKEGYIKDKKINVLLKNDNNPSKQEEILSEWFFKDYLCDYTNNVLILLEEYRNKTSFAKNQVRNPNDRATSNTIKQVIEMMEQNMGIKLHYTPLFKEPNIAYKNREERDNDQLDEYYKKIHAKLKKKEVAEIKQFGMSGKYQKNPSKEKTILIVKE